MSRIQQVAEFMSDWAKKYPVPAQALYEALQKAPGGGIRVYLPMRCLVDAEGVQPMKPVAPQTRLQQQRGTSE